MKNEELVKEAKHAAQAVDRTALSSCSFERYHVSFLHCVRICTFAGNLLFRMQFFLQLPHTHTRPLYLGLERSSHVPHTPTAHA